MKILGVRCWGIMISNKIQPISLNILMKGWWYGWYLAHSDGNPNLLSANRDDDGHWLNAYYDNPDNRWDRESGFAFSVSGLSSFLSLYIRESFVFHQVLPSGFISQK